MPPGPAMAPGHHPALNEDSEFFKAYHSNFSLKLARKVTLNALLYLNLCELRVFCPESPILAGNGKMAGSGVRTHAH